MGKIGCAIVLLFLCALNFVVLLEQIILRVLSVFHCKVYTFVHIVISWNSYL